MGKYRELTRLRLYFAFIASSQPCSHSHGSPKESMEHHTHEDEMDKEFLDIASFLEAQFGQVELNEKDKKITVNMDGVDATVDTIKFVNYLVQHFA